jgi:hypothetical protein
MRDDTTIFLHGCRCRAPAPICCSIAASPNTKEFDHTFELDASLLQTQAGKALSYKLKNDPQSGIALLHGVADQLIQRRVSDAEGIYKVAEVYAQLGDPASALILLEKSIDGGFFPYPYIVRDPLLAPIRNIPDYLRVLDKARLRYEQFRTRSAADAQPE